MSIKVTSNADVLAQTQSLNAGAKADAEVKADAVEVKPTDETVEASDASKDAAPKDESEEKDSTEGSESSDDVELQAKDSEDDANKLPKGFKRRIDKLRSKVSKAAEEAEYWKREALKYQTQKSDVEKPQVEANTQEIQTAAKVEGEPNADDYASHSEYVKDLAKWEIKQELAAEKLKQRQEAAKAEYDKLNQAHFERVDKFKKKIPDYTEVLTEYIDEHGDIKFSSAIHDQVLTSEIGPLIIYELAKNPEELHRINAMSYGDAREALGLLKARLQSSQESSETKQLRTTKAPPPLKPVGSNGSAVKKTIFDSDLTQAEYERMRAEQRKSSMRA
jgi:hypothetical protein